MIEDKFGILDKWVEASRLLTEIKDREFELRKRVVQGFFPHGKDDGTETAKLENGWQLKAQFKLNRSVDCAVLQDVLASLPAGVSDQLFRYNPELNVTSYKRLAPEIRGIVDTALVIKPGTPAVSLIPPKGTLQ